MKVLLNIQERLNSLSSEVPSETEIDLSTANPAVVFGYVNALKWVLEISESPAKAPKPEVYTEEQVKALQAALDNNKVAWGALHGKTRGTILKKGLVALTGPYPALTEAGEVAATSKNLVRSADAMDIPEDAASEVTEAEEKFIVSADQLTALQAALDHDQEKWKSIHGRTMASIAKHNLIVMFDTYPALTEAGEEIAASHKLTKSERFVEIPEDITDSTDLVKRIHWTQNQVECFKIVASRDLTRWNALSPKTRNAMINAGWLHIADGVPAYTDTGKTMAIMNGISVSSLKPEEA